MRIFFIFILSVLLSNCSTSNRINGPTEQQGATANEPDRVIQLWDNQILRVRHTSGKWEADPADVMNIKKSLLQKISAGKYKNLGKEIKPHQLVRAFGKKIRFDKTGTSTVSFFIGMSKTEAKPFIFPKEVNIIPNEQTYDTFLSALTAHVKTVNKDIGSVKTSSGKSVLEGYFVIASKEYEIAFMQWNTKMKSAIFEEKNGYTKRTGPQGSILFETNLAWEDPALIP